MTGHASGRIAALFSLAAFVVVSSNTLVARQPPVDPALRKAAEARTRARQTADAATYARLTLDDASIVGANGAMTSKQDRLSAMKTAKPNPATPKVSEDRYRMLGEAAVRTYRQDGVNAQGQKTAQRFLEVWVKQGGEWRVAAVQFSTVAEP